PAIRSVKRPRPLRVAEILCVEASWLVPPAPPRYANPTGGASGVAKLGSIGISLVARCASVKGPGPNETFAGRLARYAKDNPPIGPGFGHLYRFLCGFAASEARLLVRA